MSLNIRTKGARGEREIKDAFVELMQNAEELTKLPGMSAMVKRNSTQSDRGGDDIVGIPLLSIEVKRQEALSINSWWQQCVKSAAAQKLMPVLIYRQTRKPWRVVTYAALAHPNRTASIWARVELDLADFLCWYALLYTQWLKGETK